MKVSRTILVLSAALLVSMLVGGCGSGKYVPKANEDLYGTWVNQAYPEKKMVITPGGFKTYLSVTDTTVVHEGKEQIEGKTVSSNGTVSYKTFGEFTSGPYTGIKFQWVRKVEKSGTVLEYVERPVAEYDPKNYSTEITPSDTYYRMYFKSEQ